MNKPQKKTEEIHQLILENVEDHPADITAFVSTNSGISRQAVHHHIQKLLVDGLIIAKGTTRDRVYAVKPLVNFSRNLQLKGLEEDKVWRQYILPLMENVPANVLQICQHGFTEMVNNAIDHSEAVDLKIKLVRTYKLIELQISDNGVGIFNKIQRELKLDDPLHAILELSKGKLTTDPARHSGEGIFFTSRMFDKFSIASGKLFYSYAEHSGDWLVEDHEKLVSGTTVVLSISSSAKIGRAHV